MGKIINLILVTIVVLYNVIRAQEEEDSICKGEVPSVDPDQCCKIPIMVDEQFRDRVFDRVDEYVRRGEANKAVCKACHHVLQDLKILNEEGNIDLDVAIRFFYESLPDHKSLAEVWRVAATDCYEWIKDHHSDQYQAEHGFPKEDCDVKSEVLIFCTTTRVTAVISLNIYNNFQLLLEIFYRIALINV
jgi:hypothetical protein